MTDPAPGRQESAAVARNMESRTEREAAERYLVHLKDRGCVKGQILLIADRQHVFSEVARACGYTIAQHLTLSELESSTNLSGPFDAIVVLRQLECAANPVACMEKLKLLLPIGGVLLLTTISVDSWPRKFFGRRWTEWRAEHLNYFNQINLHGLALRHGFAQIWEEPDRRAYSLRHIGERAADCPQTLLTRAIRLVCWLTPPPFRDARLRLSTSGVILSATRTVTRERAMVSIVVPAYNEKSTIKILLEALLQKQLLNADKEIIVVESNSTDGTRDLVAEFSKHPEVKVVYQERARGKGNAVRAGFEQATGDILMIQDADLEYDLNDYDALLKPLLEFRSAFVLGARHGGDWKMRKFDDQQSLASLLNLGHVFFTGMLNVFFNQHMRDPFTMFKVFWRDCLYGLNFQCNRFDFDFELVIKLIRRGFIPLELPVNYDARSFNDGKKVRIFRDPMTWIWACIRLRLEAAPKRPVTVAPSSVPPVALSVQPEVIQPAAPRES